MKPLQRLNAGGVDCLLVSVEHTRRDAAHGLDPRRRVLLGQFLTLGSVATFMAGMIECRRPVLRVLDPGAGVGLLSAAFVAAMCRRPQRPDAIALTAY